GVGGSRSVHYGAIPEINSGSRDSAEGLRSGGGNGQRSQSGLGCHREDWDQTSERYQIGIDVNWGFRNMSRAVPRLDYDMMRTWSHRHELIYAAPGGFRKQHVINVDRRRGDGISGLGESNDANVAWNCSVILRAEHAHAIAESRRRTGR